eukprot:CAMPEP_0197828264 /NCGR_PEP_ID=MMETSP1437-20131217/4874_1 /TAXON_ID=49252 ORGANISM="Eucampia antarctica, Strain CCMP1452" /NCGR_SAMPLE_ID=MMETSP1437 /ASSEMBLY_ACC=CAM_ASM_001096 /LENGTH=389 /DNA_ID=CAMNT_0043429429 /DNA_START=61 /DNA_END=1230 /DNA_ORIENTATION=+
MKLTLTCGVFLVGITTINVGNAFTVPSCSQKKVGAARNIALQLSTSIVQDEGITKEREEQKKALMGLFGSRKRSVDPVLACPDTKEPLSIKTKGTILGGDTSTGVQVSLESTEKTYIGRTNTYYNLLESVDDTQETDNSNSVLRNLQVFIPPPLRSAVMNDDGYIPMRDLFTSPSVSFAYERGWRQAFVAAGFPGPDKEFEMVQEYFQSATQGPNPTTVVDMSCATGLFTRRLTKSNEYDRVIGCDYSDSMLTEARRRIRADRDLSKQRKTSLDLVRCDVARIPMRSESIDALHAGAAMHCWPDLDSALSEIYRVLKPGGKYFATTFLSDYFSMAQTADGKQNNVQQQAFQLFDSIDELKDMIIKAGFEESKVQIDLIGRACVVIRAEK